MRIDYFYNEKLPKRTAHDGYVWRNCFYLSQQGIEVTLITGPGEKKLHDMLSHYLPSEVSAEKPLQASIQTYRAKTRALDFLTWAWLRLRAEGETLSTQIKAASCFNWLRLPIIRKSRFFKLSWNLPFFWRCQKWIEHHRPDWVIFSVYSQAKFHLEKKIPGVRYLFEVHDLAWYPPSLRAKCSLEDIPQEARGKMLMQQAVLERCDHVTVTTPALKSILQHAPYHIKAPISIIPLASEHQPLPISSYLPKNIHLGYVGQLYFDQGIDSLIRALAQVPHLYLEVIGGKKSDLERLKALIEQLQLENRITLHGFVKPSLIPQYLKSVHVLVAPFHPTRHMRYVAHTKLVDYGRWGLPVIAPAIEGIESELRSSRFLFEASDYPESLDTLVDVLERVKKPQELHEARLEIKKSLEEQPDLFHWQLRCDKLKRSLT